MLEILKYRGKIMNILLCGNGKVFDGALTELISITNKTKEAITAYIFTMDLSRIKPEYTSIKDEQIEFLNEVVKTKNSKKRRLNYNKVALLCLVVVLIFGGVFAFKNNNKTNNEDPNENKNIVSTFNEQNEKVETYTASILAAGDIMVHTPQLKAQYNASTKTYNFDNNFKYVKMRS